MKTARTKRSIQFWRSQRNNSAAFANGENLSALHGPEPLDFLRRWPFHFDHINRLRFSDAEVQPQIALRHHARSAMHFIHLRVRAGNYAHTRPNRRSLALL